jgi:pyruvate dehydrogenase (quinone)
MADSDDDGAPKFEESQTLPEVSYAAFARSIGLEGIDVDKPEDVGPAWDRALAAGRPVVLDVRCDADIPPIPPHADFEQVKDMTKAIVKGDPDATGVAGKSIKTKAQELLRRDRR